MFYIIFNCKRAIEYIEYKYNNYNIYIKYTPDGK